MRLGLLYRGETVLLRRRYLGWEAHQIEKLIGKEIFIRHILPPLL
jgi:hypothetical protein